MHSNVTSKMTFQFPSRIPGHGSFTALAKGKTKPHKAICITPLNVSLSEER
jgi:hypothetical protein